MQEEWKEIEGFDGKYKVSSLGRFWNTFSDKEVAQVLSGIPQYKYVNLNSQGDYKFLRAHRVIAEAFIPNPENLPLVDHIDRDKFNNRISNLRWVDRKGNARNTDVNVFIEGLHAKDYVQKYDNPEAAYTHILSNMNKGFTDVESVEKYSIHLELGLKRKVVEWEGKERYLFELCEEQGKDYFVTSARLNNGYPLWNALLGVPPATSYVNSVEIKKGNLNYWFRSREVIAKHVGWGVEVVSRHINEGKTLDDLLSYDLSERHRTTVAGVYGTIDEICKHFKLTRCAVNTRVLRGMSLEEALTTPIKRVKIVTINGVRDTPKNWYEKFGLDYKKVRKYRDKTKSSFDQCLQYFGVDITHLEIVYGD